MSVNSQTIRLGVAVLGLVLVVTLCTAFPARADFLNGSTIVLGGEISRGTFRVVDLDNDGTPSVFATPKTNAEYVGYYITGAGAYIDETFRTATFTLGFSIPAGATASGYLLTLAPVSTNPFPRETLSALFGSMTITSGGITRTLGDFAVGGDSDALTLWFGADDLFSDHVQFVFSNAQTRSTMPFGAFVATIQETSFIPEPATLAILGLGLAGLGFVRSRKR